MFAEGIAWYVAAGVGLSAVGQRDLALSPPQRLVVIFLWPCFVLNYFICWMLK